MLCWFDHCCSSNLLQAVLSELGGGLDNAGVLTSAVPHGESNSLAARCPDQQKKTLSKSQRQRHDLSCAADCVCAVRTPPAAAPGPMRGGKEVFYTPLPAVQPGTPVDAWHSILTTLTGDRQLLVTAHWFRSYSRCFKSGSAILFASYKHCM